MNTTSTLTTDTVIVRSDSLIEAEVDGEVVALSIDQGTCYGLNKVGSRIWNLIAEPMRVGDICTKLVAEYDVDMPTCERQVLDLLQELHAEKMIDLRS